MTARGRWLALAVAMAILGGLGYTAWRFGTAMHARVADARAPKGVRIKVEVLNASIVRGLARRATMHLRDRGFDVVGSGSAAPAERRDSTLILDRSGHPEWAALAARAMGGASVAERPDTLRDVDLTVLVGARWRPPPEPFYP